MRNPVQYKDVYIRDNFEDIGNPSTGIIYLSPDIVPYHKDELGFPAAKDTYHGPDIGKTFIVNTDNNIYMRARNLGDRVKRAHVQGYATDASLLLVPEWKERPLQTLSGERMIQLWNAKGTADLQPGEIALVREPFALTLGAQGHHCIIGVVQSEGNMINVPSKFDSNAAFCDWVIKTPAVAFRNLIKEEAKSHEFSALCKFGNANKQPAQMLFWLQLFGAPAGASITLQSTDKACAFKHEGVVPTSDPGKPVVVTLPREGYQLVPAEYRGELRLTLKAKEKLPKFYFNFGYFEKKTPTDAADAEYALYQELASEVLLDSTTGRTEEVMPVGEISYEING